MKAGEGRTGSREADGTMPAAHGTSAGAARRGGKEEGR